MLNKSSCTSRAKVKPKALITRPGWKMFVKKMNEINENSFQINENSFFFSQIFSFMVCNYELCI